MFGKRILIAIPHPDDEIVACSAAIGRAQAEGAEIFALYLTHGCIARETRWPWERKHHDALVATRRAEGEQAAKFLGITPVGWEPRPARHLWRELSHVHAELKAAIAQYQIDQLWVPAYEGGNADHDGLNGVARSLKDQRSHGCDPVASADGAQSSRAISVLEFAEYNFFGGTANSQSFPFPNGTEQTISLSPEESAKKIAALSIYKSEQMNLNYVRTEHECWRPLAHYDYAQPPHHGTLWYARFHWVPFRHPRIDFASPNDVSNKIVNLLKNMK